jgi:hypothetical protein
VISALYVETNGVYFNLPNVDPWDEYRDARFYNGPHAVIAHPPCERWGMLARLVESKSKGLLRVGDDARCFEMALKAVETYGGVLEHPAETRAWPHFGLDSPKQGLWKPSRMGFVCQVAQSAYGHKATKKTWLYCVGLDRLELPVLKWECPRGTHEIGGETRLKEKRPSLPKPERSITPIEFRDFLIQIAETVERKR